MELSYQIRKVPGAGYILNVARSRGWPYLASWAHRITGILLLIYAILHIITLSSLKNPELFESKMKFFAATVPLCFEWLLAIPVIFHSLNGGRLLLYELFGTRRDQMILGWVLKISGIYLLLLGFFMISGNQVVTPILFWGYMASLSFFLTYLTVIRLRESKAALSWKMQRISGAFLLLMIPAHMLFMHLDPLVGRDINVITERMSNGFIKLVDVLLVCSVLYHGAYGLLGILGDYLLKKKYQIYSLIGIIVITMFFAWTGITLIFSI